MSDLHTVILDVDGTLIDSNDQHAHAWVDAGQALGTPIDYQVVRCMIGMGGDKIMPKLVGCSKQSPEGQRFAHCQGEMFRSRYLAQIRPFPQVRDLLLKMQQAGLQLVVGSSAKKEDLDQLLDIARIRDLISLTVCSGDVDQSKPSPDIIDMALARAQVAPGQAMMIGDTPYDIEAAKRAGVSCIALRCGGWSSDALAGACAIYQDPADLLAHFDTSPLGRQTAGS